MFVFKIEFCLNTSLNYGCSNITTMMSPEKCVVLVTGGSGFLGQHLIGLLQTRASYVTEIRVLDLPSNPYINKLGKWSNNRDCNGALDQANDACRNFKAAAISLFSSRHIPKCFRSTGI